MSNEPTRISPEILDMLRQNYMNFAKDPAGSAEPLSTPERQAEARALRTWEASVRDAFAVNPNMALNHLNTIISRLRLEDQLTVNVSNRPLSPIGQLALRLKEDLFQETTNAFGQRSFTPKRPVEGSAPPMLQQAPQSRLRSALGVLRKAIPFLPK